MVSEGEYNDDDILHWQDEPEETFEHGDPDWGEARMMISSMSSGWLEMVLVTTTANTLGQRTNQMTPNGGFEDSEDEDRDLYYNDPYADLEFESMHCISLVPSSPSLHYPNNFQLSISLHICLLMTTYSSRIHSPATELYNSATPATNVYSALQARLALDGRLERHTGRRRALQRASYGCAFC